MVKAAYAVVGGDLRIGAEILCRAALSNEFEAVSSQYFDIDSGQFSSPHRDALNPQKCKEIVRVIEDVIQRYLDCGDLHFGFARVKCEVCGHEFFLAFHASVATFVHHAICNKQKNNGRYSQNQNYKN